MFTFLKPHPMKKYILWICFMSILISCSGAENNMSIDLAQDQNRGPSLETKVKDLWNWFLLNQTLENTAVSYSGTEIYSWENYSEEIPFVWGEWCKKLTDKLDEGYNNNVSEKWKQIIWEKFSDYDKQICLQEYYSKSITIEKIDEFFYNIVQGRYEWYVKMLFNSKTSQLHENLNLGFIEKIETWDTGVFILYDHARWCDGWIVFIDNNDEKRTLFENNCDVDINNIPRDYREVLDFEFIWNKQVKIFYKWHTWEKEEMILNI